MKLPARAAGSREALRKNIEEAVLEAGATPDVRFDMSLSGGDEKAGEDPSKAPPNPLPGVRDIIAVGAGKGGVGKSTLAVNLAVGLARNKYQVGLLDGDIYGPSLPTMLGTDRLEPKVEGKTLVPFRVHGIRSMSLGSLVEDDRPLIWRGPMAHGAFNQLVTQTHWGELDYLIVDLPPGTGDVPLTMSQTMPLTGAVIVCTPQKVAQDDARRAVAMFRQLNIDVLGMVENMSYFIGDDGKEYDLFGSGGAEMLAQQLAIPFLGAVPINMNLRRNCDAGDPSANFTNDSQLAEAFNFIVRNVERQVATVKATQVTPSLTIR
jgi:ATP-binding protein involved in chromosome partitioning